MIQDDNLFKGFGAPAPPPPPGSDESPIYTPSGGYQRLAPPPPQRAPQTQAEARGDEARTTISEAEAQTKPIYQRAEAIERVRDNYRTDKRVLMYEAAVPIYSSALTSPETPEADILLVNAIAKVGDPSTGVQQREGAAYETAPAVLEQIRTKLLKEYGDDGAGNFSPEGRRRIKEAIRNRMSAIGDQYRLARQDTTNYIKMLHIPDADPETILGPFAGLPHQRAEENYLGRGLYLGGKQVTPGPAYATPEEIAAEPAKAPASGNLLTTKDDPSLEVNVAGGIGPRPTAAQRAADPALDAKWKRIEAYEAGGPTPHEQIQIEEDKARAFALRKQQDETSLKLQDALPGSTGGIAKQTNLERRLTNAMSAGMTDEASGIANMFTNPLAPLEGYRAGRDVERQRQEEAAKALGWGDLPLAVGGSFLSANPEAIATNLTRTAMMTKGAKQGAYGGVLGGFGYGEGAADSAKQAVIGGTIGTVAGAAGGRYAGGKQAGSNLDPDLARMSTQQDVRISAPMIQGNRAAVNRAGRLEADKGSEEIIQQGFANTAEDIGRGVQRLGGGGTVSDDVNLGINTKAAIEAGDTAAKTKYTGEYQAAEAIDGDPVIEPTDIIAAIDKRIAKLERRPGANAEAIAELKIQRGDLIEADPTKPAKELRLSDIRDMRTEMRETIKGGQNRTSGQKKADKAMMDILDGTNSDIERTLSPAAWAAWKKADASFAAEAAHFREVTKPIFGNDFDALSPEDIVKRINAASKGNTQALDRMVSRLSPDAKKNLSASVASNLGKFTGENGEDVFSAARFITQARQLSRQARATLFGPQGAAAFDDLLRLGRRLEFAKSQINVSKTTRGTGNIIRQKMGQIITLALGGGGAGFIGPAAGMVGLAAGGAGMVAGAVRRGMQARTLMDSKVTRILSEAASAQTPQDARQIASRLSAVVARQPEYADELQPIIDQISGLGGKRNKADLTAEDTR